MTVNFSKKQHLVYHIPCSGYQLSLVIRHSRDDCLWCAYQRKLVSRLNFSGFVLKLTALRQKTEQKLEGR